ncbi:MAG: hypothetical protein L6V35_05025 [Alistipes putredinis]|nr:MAG: hypothetical protein L6V35_05025 [Alistipes putredinis]
MGGCLAAESAAGSGISVSLSMGAEIRESRTTLRRVSGSGMASSVSACFADALLRAVLGVRIRLDGAGTVSWSRVWRMLSEAVRATPASGAANAIEKDIRSAASSGTMTYFCFPLSIFR